MAWTFYFAWCGSSDTTFGPTFHVVDEDLVSFRISHEEGQIPLLDIVFKNPKVGPFSVGRSRWAWLSVDDGTTVTALFFGRVVGAPVELDGGGVQYQLVAKRLGWKDIKAALAETLKVAPYYDPFFLSDTSKDDPDAVLEGYSADWHIDRFGNWTISDVLEGEDGTVSFTNATYESINLSNGQPPLKSVSYKTTATWKLSSVAAGVSIPIVSQVVETYTGEGLISDWPKPGANLGGGWIADQAFAVDLNGLSNRENVTTGFQYENKSASHENGDLMSFSYSENYPGWMGGNNDGGLISEQISPAIFGDVPTHTSIDATGKEVQGDQTVPNYSYSAQYLYTPRWRVQVYLSIRPDPKSKDFAESVTVTMTADIQPVEYEDGEGVEIESNEISANDPSQELVGAQTAFFPTDSGVTHIEYLLCLCRARLRTRARAVTATCTVPFMDGINLSCRKNGTISDDRIPGGSCTGKIIGYELYGGEGGFGCDVTLGVAIGNGGTASSPDPGEPDYVVDGVLADGIEAYSGTVTNPVSGVAYSPLSAVTTTYAFPITYETAVISAGWGGPTLQQQLALLSKGISNARAAALISSNLGAIYSTISSQQSSLTSARNGMDTLTKNNGIYFELQLRPLSDLNVSNGNTVAADLAIPKGIDLEAA